VVGDRQASVVIPSNDPDTPVAIVTLLGKGLGIFPPPPPIIPSISSVSPNPVIGLNSPQPFTINGNNFVSGVTVTLRDLSTGEVFPNRPISTFTSTRIVINPNFTTTTATWTVEVINPGGASSGQFQFEVAAPSSSENPGSFTLSANAYCNTSTPAAPAVLLNWTTSSRATAYDVYRNGTLYANGNTETSFDNNLNVSAGQTYTYYVLAGNTSGTTQSNEVTVSVPSDVCGSPPQLTVTPTSLSFADQIVQTTSPAQTVTMTNIGNVNLSLAALSLIGTNLGDYLLSENTCNNVNLEPNASCSFGVSFRPIAIGMRMAEVSIKSKTEGNLSSVSLSGLGNISTPSPVLDTPFRPEPPGEVIIPMPLPTTMKARNLIEIVHGWNSDPNVWAIPMGNKIAKAINDARNAGKLKDQIWEIKILDWRDSAKTPLPQTAYANAFLEGKALGERIAAEGYDHIHFIAHSAGSNVTQAAASWIISPAANKRPTIHSTFLDAYYPNPDSANYGNLANWAEQYVDMRGSFLIKNTNLILPAAFNFNVTALDSDQNKGDIGNHSWPYEWYEDSISPLFSRYGYPLSLEGLNSPLPSHANPNTVQGSRCDLITNFSECNGLAPVTVPVFKLEFNSTNPFTLWPTRSGTQVFTSTTGILDYSKLNLMGLSTDSPAWISINADVTEPMDTIQFDYKFISKAEGLLSVFVDDQLVFKADERQAIAGVNESVSIPVGTVAPGLHTLSFRLDPFSNSQSVIELSNLRTGSMKVSRIVNQIPTANAGADQTVSLSSLVTLNGNNSSDSDLIPSPLTFTWTQVSGPAVTLSGASTASPTFTPTITGTYIFNLTVSDGMASVSDEVKIDVISNPSGTLKLTQLLINKKLKTFFLLSNFTLDAGNNGINPVKEAVTFKIGNFSTTIPAGSFRKLSKLVYAYVGTINKVKLEATITSLGNNRYAFQAAGIGVDFSAITNPVKVDLSIGDDRGTTSVIAIIK
jgi:hypothetical protein